MDGNKVYINDAKAYISAEPHTLHESGWVYFTIISKQYTGNVDIAFGFDTETVHPKKAERLNGAGWVNIADKFDSIYWTHDGFNKWYYATNLPVVAGQTYTVRVWVDIPISTSKISGKYAFAIKSSSQTLQQAKDTNNLYYLDPWFDSTWLYKNDNAIPDGVRPYQLSLNVSNSAGTNNATHVFCNGHCNTNFTDIRFTLDDTTALPYWIEDNTTGKVWVNLTANGTVNMYYGNSIATSLSDGNTTFRQFKENTSTDFKLSNILGSSSAKVYIKYTKGGNTNEYIGISNNAGAAISSDDAMYNALNVARAISSTSVNEAIPTQNAISGTAPTTNTYLFLKDGTTSIKYYRDSILLDTITTNIPDEQMGLFMYLAGTGNKWYYGFLTDYVTYEPAWATWSDEQYSLVSSWGNDYTNNQDLSFVLASNTNVLFNLTPRYSDPISWFVDGVNQTHPFNNLSVLIDDVGITNITAVVTNSTNSQSVSWLVTLSMQLTTPANGSIIYNPYPPAAPDVTFIWTSTGYPFYNLLISTDPYFNYIVSSTYYSSETANISLLSGEQYFWKVRIYSDATTPGGWSGISNFNLTSNFSVSGLTGIGGVVYEKKNDGSLSPISEANVYIRNEALNWSSNQITGTNGYYLFDNLTNNTVYSISAKATGYEDSTTEYVTTIPSQRVTKNIILSKCISGFNCGFLTQPVTFTVRNLFDQEFPGVTVVVYKGDELTAYDTGITDSGGSVTFMLNKDVKYRVTFTGGGISGTLTYYAYGSQTNYRIVVISGFPDGGDRYDYIDANLTTSTINATHSYLTLIYNDSISSTSSISFYATNLTTGTTCWSNSTSQVATLNCSVLSSGTYRFGFTAVSSTYGTIQQDKIINFNAATSAGNPLAGKVDATLLHWGSIMLIVFMAAMFSIKTVKIGAVIVPAMALVLWSLDWLDVNFVLLATAMCIGVMVYMRSSEHKVEAY